MKEFIIYDNTTGRVNAKGLCNDADYALQSLPGSTIIQYTGALTVDDTAYYFPSGTYTARPLLTTVATWSATSVAADGVSTLTLGSGLPNPTTLVLTYPGGVNPAIAGDLVVTTGTFTFSTSVAGTYTVTAKAFPYQDYTVTLTAS